jgi:hypothetical protein
MRPTIDAKGLSAECRKAIHIQVMAVVKDLDHYLHLR